MNIFWQKKVNTNQQAQGTITPTAAQPPQETQMKFILSKILVPIAHLFTGAFTKQLPALEASAKTELSSVEQSIITFAQTDLGKLAVDAVGFVPASLSGAAAIADAKTRFIADAKTAGHDLTVLGSGVVDWMVQTAYTFAAGVVSNLPTA